MSYEILEGLSPEELTERDKARLEAERDIGVAKLVSHLKQVGRC